jgi:hypothetical protein
VSWCEYEEILGLSVGLSVGVVAVVAR